jgi:hypothetical protein
MTRLSRLTLTALLFHAALPAHAALPTQAALPFLATPTPQTAPTSPFIRVGEELTFSVRSARFGDMGTAIMRTARDTSGGHDTYRLSFDFAARVMLFKVSDRTRSWIDVATMNTVRYQKCERSPLGSRDEDARITQVAGSDGTWSDALGEHPLAAADPLDELAFIYLVRSAAPSIDGDGVFVNRHFDAKRNSVRLTNRGTIRMIALGDTSSASVIQMDARDPRQKSGTSRITFYIGNDTNRLPLRIDSSMPMAGNITMTLKRVSYLPVVIASD